MLIIIKGLTTPPENVNNLAIMTQNGTALLTWDLALNEDVRVNGSVQFRYSKSGLDWENSSKLKTVVSGQNTSVNLPLLIGTYLAKFADSAGNQSINATSITVTTVANIFNMNDTPPINQHPNFTGAKTNMVVVANKLQFDANGGDLYQFGSYEFDNYIDSLAVRTFRVSPDMSLTATNLADFIDDRDEVDTWDTIDNPPANVAVEMFISTTDDDPAGSPTWSPWDNFTMSDYTARAMKFKLEASSENLNHQIQISELNVLIQLPDRTETQRNITSGTTTKTITYSLLFLFSIPIVSITPVDMMTGDYFTISNELMTGFDINFYDSSDVPISRTFNYNSTGF